MKTFPPLLALALLLPGGFSARAEEPPRVRLHSLEPFVRVPPPRSYTESADDLSGHAETAQMVLPRHVYGGGPVTFALAVEAPLKTHLQLYADLFQTAGGRIAAPLQRDIPVTAELAFDDRTYRVAACTVPALPAVQRKTVMLLKLRTARDPSASAADLGVGFAVYPPEEPGAWKKTLAARLTHSGLRRLAVFGEMPTLRQFLRARGVEFDDLGEDWPAKFDARTFYVGETHTPPPPRFGDFPGTRLMLFAPLADATLLPPGVYQTADPSGGSLWKVILPGLFVEPDDPGAQETLAEIFRLALEPRAHSTNDTHPDPTTAP